MKYSNLTVNIPEELKEEVKKRAESEGLTRSDIVMVALAKFLEKSSKNKNLKEGSANAYLITGSESSYSGSKSIKTCHKSNKRVGKNNIYINNPLPLPKKPYDRVKDLIGQIPIDISDLGRNHKYYISKETI